MMFLLKKINRKKNKKTTQINTSNTRKEIIVFIYIQRVAHENLVYPSLTNSNIERTRENYFENLDIK